MKLEDVLHIEKDHIWRSRQGRNHRVKVTGVDTDSGTVYYVHTPKRGGPNTGAMTLTEFVKQYAPVPRAS